MAAESSLQTRKIFLCGYFREIEKLLKQSIPKEIEEIIKLYEAIAAIFGIGSNQYGQLGFVSQTKRLDQFTELKELQNLASHADRIYPSKNALMVLKNNDEIFVAGRNDYHKLGIKTREKFDSITEFTKLSFPDAIDIKLASNGAQSGRFSFIYTKANELYASGCNNVGVLGFKHGEGFQNYDECFELKKADTDFLGKNESIEQIECAASKAMFLSNRGCVYATGYGTDGYGKSPALLVMNNGNIPIIKVSAGYDHILFLDKQQRLITWGENDAGHSSSDESIYEVEKPTFHPYFIENEIKISNICASSGSSLCIDIDGGCYLFGENSYGKVGNGTADDNTFVPFKINERISNELVVDASLGTHHTVLLTNKNNVITFGLNDEHQCSTMEEGEILDPHIVSKTNEIGIFETSFIENVLAINDTTLIFVNPNKIAVD